MTWKNAEADYHNADSTIVNEWSAIRKEFSNFRVARYPQIVTEKSDNQERRPPAFNRGRAEVNWRL